MGALTVKGGEIKVFAGLASSSQTVEFLLRTPGWQRRLELFGKSGFGEFTSMEYYTQQLLFKCICQSQKFDKPAY